MTYYVSFLKPFLSNTRSVFEIEYDNLPYKFKAEVDFESLQKGSRINIDLEDISKFLGLDIETAYVGLVSLLHMRCDKTESLKRLIHETKRGYEGFCLCRHLVPLSDYFGFEPESTIIRKEYSELLPFVSRLELKYLDGCDSLANSNEYMKHNKKPLALTDLTKIEVIGTLVGEKYKNPEDLLKSFDSKNIEFSRLCEQLRIWYLVMLEKYQYYKVNKFYPVLIKYGETYHVLFLQYQNKDEEHVLLCVYDITYEDGYGYKPGKKIHEFNYEKDVIQNDYSNYADAAFFYAMPLALEKEYSRMTCQRCDLVEYEDQDCDIEYNIHMIVANYIKMFDLLDIKVDSSLENEFEFRQEQLVYMCENSFYKKLL